MTALTEKPKQTVLVMMLAATMIGVPVSASNVTFWTWSSGAALQSVDELLDILREQRPDITITYETSNVRYGESLLVAIAAGVPPDLVTTHQDFHRDFANQSLFLDLRPYIERDKFDMSLFPQGVMEFYTGPNGEITGLPSGFTVIVLGYNKALFERFGVALPEATWMLDDMVEAARKITLDTDGDGEADQWGLHTGVLSEYVWRLWGLKLMTEDGKKTNLDHPRAIEAFRWLASLYLEHGVVGDSGGGQQSPRWTQGKIGMALAWPHYLIQWGQTLQDLWDVEQIPTAVTGTKEARGATYGWAIPATAKNPEGAWEVLKFLTSFEIQLELAARGRGVITLPAIHEHYRRIAEESVDFAAPGSMRNIAAIVAAHEYASIDQYPPGYGAIWREIINPGVQQIVSGAMPPEVVLPEVARRVNVRVAENQ